MSDFIEQEAEETSEEEVSGSDQDQDTPDTEKKRKKKQKEPTKKKKKIRKIQDSDDEEDDEDDDGEDLQGFINDDDEKNEEEVEQESDEDEPEDIDDDDYDLIEENLGRKIKRKKKHKRIRRLSDGEESDEGKEDDRDVIAREIFEDEDDTPAAAPVTRQPEPTTDLREEEEGESGEESEDVDDFIVDDDGQPISTGKNKRHIIHDDAALQEAQDIFGVDFDFNEFDQFAGDEEMEEEEEEEYEEEEEHRVKKKTKRKAKKATIYDVFEPSELERSLLTERDQEIRIADTPERFQLRSVPVSMAEPAELEEEARWIHQQAFVQPPISRQDYWDQMESTTPFQRQGATNTKKSPTTVDKVKAALNFMRNQQFEVPFIAFYRKEYVEPELNINDLWKIYEFDEKWCQLQQRKDNLIKLLENMKNYQFSTIDYDKPLESHVRTLTEEDLDRVRSVCNLNQLADNYQHFLLYYGNDIAKMKIWCKEQQKKAKETEGESQEENKNDDETFLLKTATRKSGYNMCVTAGLADMARRFGIAAEKLAENIRDDYQRHDLEQDPSEPKELAYEFLSNQFKSPEDVLTASRHMVAMQIAHEPLVRQTVRDVFYEQAYVSAHPTEKGKKEIDESHACYCFKYLKNKPITELRNDQFIKILQAVDENNLELEIHLDEKDPARPGLYYYNRIMHLYERDEFSHLVQEWNKERSMALHQALYKILLPQLVKEVKVKLIEEGHEHIVRSSCRKLYNWLKTAPFVGDREEDDEDSSRQGVLGIAFEPFRDTASYAAFVDSSGQVSDFIRLPHLNQRRMSPFPEERARKEAELEKIKDFINSKRPLVIAVGGACREADTLVEDLKQIIQTLEQEEQLPPIAVELVDTELAHVFSGCKKSEMDMREYPPTLRQAVSIARRLQDPLIEFSQLCNLDEDILSLKYHPLQDVVPKDKLLFNLNLEFINRVNEVGVEINRCVAYPYTATLLQFVCGLGPRKATNLLRTLKQNNSRLENRTQLVMVCRMGPKVFINCAGFIKIDTSALGDSTDIYVEVLDGSRVHPETYEWARKMAVDALEYDDTAADANPTGALEEILENPDRLKDLDLDAFADELERLGHGDKHITLYDIRAELNHRYKDLRVGYRSPTAEEKFNMLTRETPQTLYIGKLVQCRVTGFAHKRPHGEQLDQANPVRDDATGLWQCPFCQKNDFPELSEVWNHFDSKSCPGQAVGVKARLDNGLFGFIPLSRLSDKKVENPGDRVQIGMAMYARVTKINIDKFEVELTSRSSDLKDDVNKWRPGKDACYGFEDEQKDKKKEEEKLKQKRPMYTKRVIKHSCFENIDYKSCVQLMADKEPGEAIIRPSTKGDDHLTLTWKVAADILHHVDIKEMGKANLWELGKTLVIGGEEFEDLDEIIARYVHPMAGIVREIQKFKYYRPSIGSIDKMTPYLYEEKKKAPAKIPYLMSESIEFPGKYLLGYMPNRVRFEFFTITSEGLRYRSQMFSSLQAVIKWFKDHYADIQPANTPRVALTPSGGAATPGAVAFTPHVDHALLQKAAAGLSALGFQTPLRTPLGLGTPLIGVPSATPIMRTPQFMAPTPRAQWPGATPTGPIGRSGVDWAKMAQQWAKKTTTSSTRGDTTPLCDE